MGPHVDPLQHPLLTSMLRLRWATDLATDAEDRVVTQSSSLYGGRVGVFLPLGFGWKKELMTSIRAA